jgi:uncharacterized repeat protein (TIGR03803 family)
MQRELGTLLSNRVYRTLFTIVFLVFPFGTSLAQIPTFSTLYHFRARNDGTEPLMGKLLADERGNLYGTTYHGGSYGYGTVFELSPPITSHVWTETILYNFSGDLDGRYPSANLIADPAGNLYGTTYYGGSSESKYASGTVLKLSPPTSPGGAWVENVIYRFKKLPDGSNPGSGLVLDAAGNLYGETNFGGSCSAGIIFELSPPPGGAGLWTETVLHDFQGDCGGFDGRWPYGGLTLGSGGVLFGTTIYGPTSGTVFELQPPSSGQTLWTYQVIHNFLRSQDGGNPYGGVTIDDSGNLYGTAATGGGGSGTECLGVSCGVIFELTPPANTGGDWIETILYVFTGGNDGATPESPLLLDKQGNLYGTALNGGLGTCKSPYALGCGSAFELIPPNMSGGTWTEITLHTFAGAQTDQGLPYSGLTFGKGGKLYGASAGRVGAEPEQNGTIFQIIP